jgi:hypothetical protein
MLSIVVAAGCLAVPAQAKGAGSDPRGFIYGTVETSSGNSYSGIMRWGTEEIFWDDLFHASKKDLPHIEVQDGERRRRITVFGITVGYRYDDASSGRLLVARFGDIKEIRVRGGDKADLLMKSGTTITVDGGSNDVGGEVTIFDDELGGVELAWKKIETITFKPTPRDIQPPAQRLYGKLKTEDGATFEGYVQWDKQECLFTDELDGESEDGDLSIEMGRIRRISTHSRSASRVELKDGREFVLRGTNDVNSDNRGIMIEDERFGRVVVSWDAFEELEFIETGKSGRGYDAYKPGKELRGVVTTKDGKTHSGRLIFDLDESETWEMLHGSLNDVEYVIPFEKVRSVRPDRWDASVVELVGGIELKLEDGQDVSDKNAGVAIEGDGADPEAFVAWDDVKSVTFE